MIFQNELIFLLYSLIVSATALAALSIGKEALVAYVTVLAVLANVLVLKQISLLEWHATASDVLIIGSVFGLNLIQEYFGKNAARVAIWTSFSVLIFYTIISQLHLLYIPAASDTMHPHFVALLQSMPRITIASLMSYLVVQHVDMALYGFLRVRWQSEFMVLRNYCSTAISQLLDTILFGFFGLYGLVDHLVQILVVSYIIKIVAILLIGPFVALSKKVVRSHLFLRTPENS